MLRAINRQNTGTNYATYFDESVYNLRPTLATKKEKLQRYTSVHHDKVRKDTQSHRGRKQSFGAPNLARPHPNNFLKKHAIVKPVRLPDAKQALQEKRRFSQTLVNVPVAVQARATVPLRYPYHIGDDWIKDNKKEVCNIGRKQIPMRHVDGRTGHGELLKHSGLVPFYSLKTTFGRIPGYVRKYQRQSQDRHENSMAASAAAQMEAHSHYEYITPEQRQEVLDNLQKSHGLIMKKFLGQSFALDNQTKIRDQLLLEKELVELEKQIDIVKRHKVIVVKKDDSA